MCCSCKKGKYHLGIYWPEHLMSNKGGNGSALVRIHVEYCIQLWPLHFKKEAGELKRIQKKVARMIGNLENMTCESKVTFV